MESLDEAQANSNSNADTISEEELAAQDPLVPAIPIQRATDTGSDDNRNSDIQSADITTDSSTVLVYDDHTTSASAGSPDMAAENQTTTPSESEGPGNLLQPQIDLGENDDPSSENEHRWSSHETQGWTGVTGQGPLGTESGAIPGLAEDGSGEPRDAVDDEVLSQSTTSSTQTAQQQRGQIHQSFLRNLHTHLPTDIGSDLGESGTGKDVSTEHDKHTHDSVSLKSDLEIANEQDLDPEQQNDPEDDTESGQEVDTTIVERDNRGNTMVHTAVEMGKGQFIDQVLDGGTEWEKLQLAASMLIKNEEGNTSYMVAGGGEKSDISRKLMDGERNPQILDIILATSLRDFDQTGLFEMLTPTKDGNPSLLHIAAKTGHTRFLSGALAVFDSEQRITLLNMRHSSGLTPVQLAAWTNQDAQFIDVIMELSPGKAMTLLCSQIEPMTPKVGSATATHLAARHNECHDVMRALLTPVDISERMAILAMRDDEGRTPLHLAAEHNKNPLVVEMMIEPLDERLTISLLHERDKNGSTPIHCIAGSTHRSAEVAKVIIQRLDAALKTELITMPLSDSDKWTPVHMAAGFNENPEVIGLLLHGLCVEQLMFTLSKNSADGYTALHFAAAANEISVIKRITAQLSEEKLTCLLEQIDDQGNTPVHEAAKRDDGNVEAIWALMEGLSMVNKKKFLTLENLEGKTPFQLAKANPKTGAVLMIMEAMILTLDK